MVKNTLKLLEVAIGESDTHTSTGFGEFAFTKLSKGATVETAEDASK